MTLAQLNAKIAKLPTRPEWVQEEARYLRDERLGILGCIAGQEPTEAQVDIVNAQLFGEGQKNLP